MCHPFLDRVMTAEKEFLDGLGDVKKAQALQDAKKACRKKRTRYWKIVQQETRINGNCLEESTRNSS